MTILPGAISEGARCRGNSGLLSARWLPEIVTVLAEGALEGDPLRKGRRAGLLLIGVGVHTFAGVGLVT